MFGILLGHGQLAAAAPGKGIAKGAGPSLADMQRAVVQASAHDIPWGGPRSGPPGRTGATVAIVCEDLRNGGILGVAKGIDEAVKAIAWNAKLFDAGGTPAGRSRALAEALASRPDGAILVGVDAKAVHGGLLPFAEHGIPIVGWHVGPVAGPVPGSPVAVNISTNPLDVARIAAMAAVVESRGHAGVVVFTDGNFEIARTKANAMADVIRACESCALLEVRDIPISRSARLVPGVTKDLLARHGRRWTHALAINDIYFDYAVPELTRARLPSAAISMLSAGDGSPAAFLRIQAGTFQTGTVAEPLNFHGWQLVDELNRLLSRQPVTGYVAPVHLVTRSNIAFDGGPRRQYDPDNGYRDIYRRIWQR